MSDAEVLAELDRLLKLDPQNREAELEHIEARDPPLHARLARLCSAATDDNSHVLAQPVAAGLRSALPRSALMREAGEVFAGYRLLRELGRGGMAVVWLAEREDGVVKRPVALKLPLSAVSPLEAQRFAREKDVLAALSHPHIARLYDAGVAHSGQPYLVLEYIDGVTLTAYCDHHHLTIDARLRLFLDVLAAVDHAHTHLVVHRDLKPSNILVDRQGSAKLLDFGIARLLADPAAASAPAEITQHGGMALTPLYAAPEQVLGLPISTLTDVYVLGAVLHEVLAGTGPHAKGVRARPSLAQWVEAVSQPAETHVRNAPMDDEAAHLRGLLNARRLRHALAGDLDVIVQKAMRHAPSQRYSSAAHFADDVRRYLARKPLAARPTSLWYSAGLFVRRHRAASVVAALGAAASLTAGVIALQKQSESRMYEVRSAAVRDFMFDLVGDAEPSESQPDAPVMFVDMIGGAVQRARTEFTRQPRLQGELLGELGRMYGRLGDLEKSTAILDEALQILVRSAPADDPALNKARAHLADAAFAGSELGRARSLAIAARDSCTQRGPDCAKARAYAFNTLSKIAHVEGRIDEALADMRQAVQETIRAFGEFHAETATALVGLAVMARNGGHLVEAASVMTRAVEISNHVALRKADRTELLRTMAVIDLDLGRYDAARDRLKALLTTTTDRDERALQLRLLANVLLGQNEAPSALEAANSALALADTGKTDVEGLFALQAHARALALTDQSEQAIAEIGKVVSGLIAADYALDSMEVSRARRFRALILLRAARAPEALPELESVLAQMNAINQPPQLEFGLSLDSLGCVLRALDRATDAHSAHLRARTHLEKQLPADHPLMLRNTLFLQSTTPNPACLRVL